MGSPGPDFNIYAEYQVGAYENADLVVVIIAQKNRVALGIRNAQEGVLIGDAPPFLLLAGNDPNDYRYPDPL